jgi:hypothetical protein
MNALRICKLHKDCLTGIGHGAIVLLKRLNFFHSPIAKAAQGPRRTMTNGEGVKIPKFR